MQHSGFNNFAVEMFRHLRAGNILTDLNEVVGLVATLLSLHSQPNATVRFAKIIFKTVEPFPFCT